MLGGWLRCPLPCSGPGGMPLAATGPAPEAGVPGVPSPLSGAVAGVPVPTVCGSRAGSWEVNR